MTPDQKTERIKYLWFRVRTVYNMVRFIVSLRQN